jgi:hypothetical protein
VARRARLPVPIPQLLVDQRAGVRFVEVDALCCLLAARDKLQHLGARRLHSLGLQRRAPPCDLELCRLCLLREPYPDLSLVCLAIQALLERLAGTGFSLGDELGLRDRTLAFDQLVRRLWISSRRARAAS